MVLSTSEYSSLYGQYKRAEGDVLQWIRSVSEASKTGRPHCYSYHKVLAKKASSMGHVMPQEVQEKTKLAFLNRITIAEDHLERGELCEKHEFSIEMLSTLIQYFLPPAEAENIISRRSTDLSSNFSQSSTSSSRPMTPPLEQDYPQSLAASCEWQPQSQMNYYTTDSEFAQGVYPMAQQMPFQQPFFESHWTAQEYQYESPQTTAPAPGLNYHSPGPHGVPAYTQDGYVYYA